MPLNSSGPISIGGTTVGQSIQLELGMSGTATASLNDANFRGLAGVASGTISLFNFYGKSAAVYYLATHEYTDASLTGAVPAPSGVGTDSTGATYFFCSDGINQDATNIYKVTPSGTLSFARRVNTTYSTGGVADASGNMYGVGYFGLNATTGGSIFKFNSSGVKQWHKSLAISGNYWTEVAVNSSGDAFVGGIASPQIKIAVGKYNTSGTLQFYRRFSIGSPETGEVTRGLAIDSSSNFYFSAKLRDGGGILTPGVVKYNSSGVLQWVRILTPNAPDAFSGGQSRSIFSTADSSGNSYVTYMASRGSFPSTNSQYVIKLDTSGNTLWSRRFIHAVNTTYIPIEMKTDASGNVYILLEAFNTGDMHIVKYNTSGVFQWRRRFFHSSGAVGPLMYAMEVSSDAVILSGIIPDVNEPFFDNYGNPAGNNNINIFIRVPSDGSKTGTYTNIGGGGSLGMTYQSFAMTEESTTHTNTAGSYSEAAVASPPDNTVSVSDSALAGFYAITYNSAVI